MANSISCQCQIAFPETHVLEADEHWHCTRCGWPLPAEHWRVQHEIETRRCAVICGVSPDALRPVVGNRPIIEYILRRARLYGLIGLITSGIMVAMSLAQVFGLVGRPAPMVFYFCLGFFFSVTIGMSLAVWRIQNALF